MKLYQFPYSHYSAKVKIVLLEKGLSFEAPELSADYPHSPEFLALNPLGKVPFLQDGDFGIGESEVIVEYLEDRYPQPALLPSTPQGRARSRWLSGAHGKPVPDAAMPRLVAWFAAVKQHDSVVSVLKAAEVALGK